MKGIEEFKEAIQNDHPEALKIARRFEKGKALNELILREYGKTLSKKEYLMVCAEIFIIKNFRVKEILRELFPFHVRTAEKYEDLDFIIFLNKTYPRKVKFSSVIHETLHYVDNEKRIRRTYEEIEKETKTILLDFLRKWKSLVMT